MQGSSTYSVNGPGRGLGKINLEGMAAQALLVFIIRGGEEEEGVGVGTTNTTMTKTTMRTGFTSEERLSAASARAWACQGWTDDDDCPTTSAKKRTKTSTGTTASHCLPPSLTKGHISRV